MPISTIQAGNAPTALRVVGAMTIYEAVAHKVELLQALAEREELVLDLSEVDEIDTAGLQLLVLAAREGAKAGKPVRVIAGSAPVQEVLERYGLRSIFRLAAAPGCALATSPAVPGDLT